MSRGRFVSRSIASNEELRGVSLRAHFLFMACIPHLDVDGRISGKAPLLKFTVLDNREEFDVGDIPALLRELCRAVDGAGVPLIRWYQVGNRAVVWFPKFLEQQQGMRRDREAVSKLPPWTELAVDLSLSVDSPAPPPPTPGVGAARGPAQVEVEVKGKVQDQVTAGRPPVAEKQPAQIVGTIAPTYGLAIVVAANKGLGEKYGEVHKIRPFNYGHAATSEVVDALEAAKVPAEFAKDAIYTLATECKLPKPPKTIKYFQDAVVQRWEAKLAMDETKDFHVTKIRAAKRPDSEMTSVGAALANAESPGLKAARQAEQEAQTAYDAARRAAVEAWGADPGNAGYAQQFLAKAIAAVPGDERMMGAGRQSEYRRLVAEHIGFPDFPTWWTDRKERTA